MIVLICIGTCALCSDNGLQAQDEMTDQAEMMAKWQAFATPGAEHERLKSKVGKWNVTNKMWVIPDAPDSESTGTAEYQMIMDGRYLEDHSTGHFS